VFAALAVGKTGRSEFLLHESLANSTQIAAK